MARRRQNYDAGYEEAGPPRMRRRSSSSSNGVIIALASAGVIGIVLFFVINSGASGEREKAAARILLRDLFETFAKNDARRGAAMIDPRQVLADTQKSDMKAWHDLTEAQQQEKRVEAWRYLKAQAEMADDIGGLGFRTMQDYDRIEPTMVFDWNPAIREVVVSWDLLANKWRVRLKKNSDGSFTVLDFRRWT